MVEAMTEELMTVAEVAEFFRVTPMTVYRWVGSGKIRGVRVGRTWRVPRSEVDKVVAS